MLNRAVRSGHRIGKSRRCRRSNCATWWPIGLAARVLKSQAQAGPTYPFRHEALAATMLLMPHARRYAMRALLNLGNQGLLRLGVAPLTQEIGERWRAGELTAAHEHFFTASASGSSSAN